MKQEKILEGVDLWIYFWHNEINTGKAGGYYAEMQELPFVKYS
jgi:hypothetical protein